MLLTVTLLTLHSCVIGSKVEGTVLTATVYDSKAAL